MKSRNRTIAQRLHPTPPDRKEEEDSSLCLIKFSPVNRNEKDRMQ